MKIDAHALNQSLSFVPAEDAPFLMQEGACIIIGREQTRFDETFTKEPALGTQHLILIQDKHILPEALFIPRGDKIAVFEMIWHADGELLLHCERVVREEDIEDYFEDVMEGLRDSIDRENTPAYPTFETACLTDDVLIGEIVDEAMSNGSVHVAPGWASMTR